MLAIQFNSATGVRATKSVLEAVAEHAQQRPDDIAVTDGTEALSYAALRRAVLELAGMLDILDDGRGPVGLCLENSPAWVLLDLALISAGRAAVPIPLFFTEAQRRHALGQAGVATLISDRPLVGHSCSGTLTVLGCKLYVHDQDGPAVGLPATTAKITYSSGTTSQAKGVCLAQYGLEQVANSLVDVIGAEYAGTHCAVLPLAVLLENVAGLYPTLLAGGRYHVPSPASLGFGRAFAPDFAMLARALRNCEATSVILVPEILRGLLQVLADNAWSLPAMKLIAVGGARVSRDLLAQAESLKLPVFQGYCVTEAASVIALNTPGENRPGSVGRPLPHIRLELAGDGEILIRRPAFLGYAGADPAPDMLATGDIGHLDEDGHLHIDGRKSNLLTTGFGRNVAPEWVESELLSQAQIGQALVFGEGVSALGALIVPSPAQVDDADLAAAIDRANRNLPNYAQIRHWSKVSPFTIANHQLTGTGRLRRGVIHDDHRLVMTRCLERPGQYVGFVETLIAATAEERALFQQTPQIRDGLDGRISRETYLLCLAEAYHRVKHTVSLVQCADERLPPERAWLREALDRYVAAAAGHAEGILADIAMAGGDADAVRSGTPRLATELMIAYAYDFVGRINPVGFFGMVFVLEATSTQFATPGARALMPSLNLPERRFRYLLSQGAADADHIRSMQTLLNRIDDACDRAAVIHMAQRMFVLFADMFRSIPHRPDQAHVD